MEYSLVAVRLRREDKGTGNRSVEHAQVYDPNGKLLVALGNPTTHQGLSVEEFWDSPGGFGYEWLLYFCVNVK